MFKMLIENKILRLAALIAALGIIINQAQTIIYKSQSFDDEYVKLVLVGLNLLVLIAFFLVSKKIPDINFLDENGKINYCDILNIGNASNIYNENISVADKKNERVNKLTSQLNRNILMYAFFLILVYSFYIFDNSANASNHKYYKIAEDIFNFLSAIFIFLAFKVLYDQTLDEEGKEIIYYSDAIIIAIIYLLSYTFFVIIPTFNEIPSELYTKMNQKTIDNIYLYIKYPELQRFMPSNLKPTIENMKIQEIVTKIFGLICGVFNGVVMALLFSRYISMEHSVNGTKSTKIDLISICTIFILPIYAIVQPLFGSFDIKVFGDADKFANWVFFICLIGKLFFLYLTYIFLQRQYIQLYLHMVITRDGVRNKLASCFGFPPI